MTINETLTATRDSPSTLLQRSTRSSRLYGGQDWLGLHTTACHIIIVIASHDKRSHNLKWSSWGQLFCCGSVVFKLSKCSQKPASEAVITQRKFFKKTARGKVINWLRVHWNSWILCTRIFDLSFHSFQVFANTISSEWCFMCIQGCR